MDHVRDLLTAAADTVGWQLDLDQLPITCAQVPTAVLTLIEASAAHLAGLASARILDDAAACLRTVMTGADTTPDREARLLVAVLDATDARQRHLDQTRRRLLAALQDLQSDGATWPPPPAPAPTGDTDTPTGLAAALTGLGLHPTPTDDTSGIRYAYTTYSVEHGQHKITVTVHPDDGDSTEVHAFDGHALTWCAALAPGTPQEVIVAAVRGALATHPDTVGRLNRPDVAGPDASPATDRT